MKLKRSGIQSGQMLTAVVLTKNEEKDITACLKSLSFCDEIIVIDGFSSDKTIEKCKKCQIYKRHLNNDFAAQRNFGLTKAKEPWVLYVDADEIVSGKLAKEIIKAVNSNEYDGFYLQRQDIFLGKKLRFGELYRKKFLRLAKKGKGRWVRPVHEVWEIKGRIGKLDNPLWHYSHKTISDLLQKINYYSTVNARYLHSQKTPVTLVDIFLYPSFKFFLNFFIKLGFLDGTAGFIFSVMMSLHSFLTRAKLYFLTQHD